MAPSSFVAVLSEYQRRSGRSQRVVALAAGLDPGRYSRLLSGDRPPATREQVLTLAAALGLDRRATDRLVAAAGFLPPGLEQAGVDDPAVAALLDALLTPDLDEPARAALRQAVAEIAAHWGRRRPDA
jgi:transcriptional regulator with XRE-family HTH domain